VPGNDIHYLTCIAPWVFGSICAGIAVGFSLRRNRGSDPASHLAEDRRATLKVLMELLGSVDQIHGQMECHNSEIRQTAEDVGSLNVSGEMDSVRQALLRQMAGVLASNRRLQEDLTCTRYRMEEQAEEIDQARREARTDALTGVANRKALEEKLHLLVNDYHRQSSPFVLILCDLDHFKRINDAHGHPAGDRVLEMIGERLKQWAREGDFVARYGGDEFVILLPQTEPVAGREIALTLCGRVADKATLTIRGEQVSLSVSMGVAAPRPGDTAALLLERADTALYKSKERGRNQICADDPPGPPPPAPPASPEAPGDAELAVAAGCE
jgi:diguanylate cyclase